MNDRIKEKFEQFERGGEDEVRNILAANGFTEGNKSLAIAWLEKKDRERNESSKDEQLRIHRSSKNAAWIAASAAIAASIIAVLTLIF